MALGSLAIWSHALIPRRLSWLMNTQKEGYPYNDEQDWLDWDLIPLKWCLRAGIGWCPGIENRLTITRRFWFTGDGKRCNRTSIEYAENSIRGQVNMLSFA